MTRRFDHFKAELAQTQQLSTVEPVAPHAELRIGGPYAATGALGQHRCAFGVIKVPVLNAWCGVPLRVAAATSAFMIGVTATPGAIIYYGRGQLIPALAAAAVLGVQLGSWRAMRLAPKVPAKWLKLLMAVVLGIVAILMFVRPR